MKQSQNINLSLYEPLKSLLQKVDVIIPETREQMFDLCFESKDQDVYEIWYEVPGKGSVMEGTITRCRNGISVNYTEPYMRRRDPEAMVIADDSPTDKTHFRDRFDTDFQSLKDRSFAWLAAQKELIVLPFWAGGEASRSYPAVMIAPRNAAFFSLMLADLQGFIPLSELNKHQLSPIATIIVAPPFRHTDFDGKQVVVHNRTEDMHEVFCFNLYPGPSAKKGVYGVLLNIGEKEGWTTLHSSAVRLITPYDNELVILHEGASGGGKSEMAQPVHRQPNGKILLGRSTISDTDIYLELQDTCELYPVTDDMSLAHPLLQPPGSNRLTITDAEMGWFVRVNHLSEYGSDPQLERLCVSPPKPLAFLNIDAQPRATALLWEHIEDAPGKPCPNPRVIVPRNFIPNIVHDKVEIDVRSFGVRTPPSSKETPNYGILGMLHILPPSLAWLWRLVAPRGHSNPSILSTKDLSSEGVGTYWPFATGKMIAHANILLRQIQQTPGTRYVLIPNQFIGAYEVGFSPEWISREYLARRGGANFRKEQLHEARCPLLGYTPKLLRVNGQEIPSFLLRVDRQLEVGKLGYDAGAEILTKFFRSELGQFRDTSLHPLGRAIIDICLQNGSLDDYEKVLAL